MNISDVITKLGANGAVLQKPAIDDEIIGVESRLGRILPKSYADFLRITNGISNYDTIYGRLLGVKEIGLFKELSKATHDIWTRDVFTVSDEEYYIYDDTQDTVKYRPEYLTQCIQISEEYDGAVILLNPMVMDQDEMELIVLASWYPGAGRYRKFLDFLAQVADQLRIG